MTGRLKNFGKGSVNRMYNKYGAKLDNRRRSKKERERAWELKMLERAGKIQSLSEQVPFELIPAQDGERAATYIADFTYWKDGKFIVEDVKGYKGGEAYRLYVLKRKLMLYRYGIHVREV